MKAQNFIRNHPVFGKLKEEIVPIYFEGELIESRKGQTVAAALMAYDIKQLGLSRKLRQSLGVFCNVGRCCSCFITINNEEHVRACMTLVESGMKIKLNKNDPDIRSNIYED